VEGHCASRRDRDTPSMISEITKLRFFAKVYKTLDGCWNWTSETQRSRLPYGRFWMDGKSHLAHRVAWLIEGRPLLDSEFVLHHCDNPRCVNPAHLFLGTQTDNMRDAKAKGRLKHPGMMKGHTLSQGERHRSAKLKSEDVLNMRQHCKFSDIPDLSKRFGISKHSIYMALTKRTWRHL